MLHAYQEAVRHASLTRRIGFVSRLSGLSIEVTGLEAGLGDHCSVQPGGGGAPVAAEVIGVSHGRLCLMAFGSTQGLAAGNTVVATGMQSMAGVGDAFLGRVVDGFGEALDGRPSPLAASRRPLKAPPSNPMQRPRISTVLETGVRSIDALLTLGTGQRVGVFAGSGVGKSTLLGLIARHVKSDVNVIALIGERGREVREFVEKHLGKEGLHRSVVVAATSDQAAPARLRAAYSALALAEHFRNEGRHVLLMMDSVTRFAMARRETGLAAGEPPAARGYTPSVFAELPELCERCGTAPSGGSITALMTVLVEGDDFNEPVADSLRAILDGHIVLTRELAHAGHFPAIDVLRSASRVMPDVADIEARGLASRAVRCLALLERHRQMVDLGAYTPGSNPALDDALAREVGLKQWLQQEFGGVPREEALATLRKLLAAGGPA